MGNIDFLTVGNVEKYSANVLLVIGRPFCRATATHLYNLASGDAKSRHAIRLIIQGRIQGGGGAKGAEAPPPPS